MDDRRALRWATVCVLLPIAFYLPTIISFAITPAIPFFAAVFGLSKLYGFDVMHMPEVIFAWFTSGDIGDWFKLTTTGVFVRFADLIFTGRPFKVLAMFIVGMVVGRRAMWVTLDANATVFRRIALWGYAIGVPANCAWAAFKNSDAYYTGSWHGLAETTLYAFAVAPLALSYAATFALLWRHDTWARVLRVFAPAGKMALTNYLSQTVLAVLVFSGFGLGLAGHVGPTWLWVQAIATMTLQTLFSSWWLTRYRFGPMEWVWRSLTYRARQPMSRGPAKSLLLSNVAFGSRGQSSGGGA
jgi:uncharacterized protein